MKKNILFLLTTLLITGCSASDKIDKSILPNDYFTQELEKEDKKLNGAYKQAKKDIEPFRVESLKEMQRTWIKYRDQKCDFYYHKRSGSGGITESLECKLEMTLHRTKELINIH